VSKNWAGATFPEIFTGNQLEMPTFPRAKCLFVDANAEDVGGFQIFQN